MRYQWLLFDADGTLFDYDRAEAAALEKSFAQIGHPLRPEYAQAYRRINGRLWHDLEQSEVSPDRLKVKRFELLFAEIGLEADAEAFSAIYLKHLAEGTYLIEGAAETLRALHGRVGLMVITNGLEEVQRPRLAKSAIGGFFADIVVSEEIGAAKPERRIFEVAFEKMGSPPKENVLIIGDSLTSDIKGGDDYGMDTCWFNPTGRPRDQSVESTYEIERLGELLQLVGV